MKRFPEMGDTEERFLTVGMGSKFPSSLTFTGSPTVSIAVYDKSDITDPSPNSRLSGSASLNSGAMVIDGETVGINRAITQKVIGVLPGVQYVVSFLCSTSDGQKFREDVILPGARYVPVT